MRMIKFYLLLSVSVFGLATVQEALWAADGEKDAAMRTQVLEIQIPGIGESLKIEYLEQGKGLPLILLHGFGASIYTWRNNIDALSQQFTVYAYNHLGVGQSNNPFIDPKRNRVTSNADAFKLQLLYFMDKMKIKKAILAGNSMGCQIALAFAGEYPERVSGLVLMDPSGGSQTGASFGTTFGKIREFSDNTKTYPPDEIKAFVKSILEEVYFDDQRVTETLVENYLEQWKTNAGREAIHRITWDFFVLKPQQLYKLLYGAWQMKAGKQADHPCLILWGKEDPWFPVSGISEYINELPGAQAVEIEKAGHLPHEEQPSLVEAEILRFFKEKPQGIQHKKIVLDDLLNNLQSGDNTLIGNTACALGTIHDERAVKALAGLLGGSLIVRELAQNALIRMGAKAVQVLFPDMANWEIAWTLIYIGEPAVDGLIKGLQSEDRKVRYNAAMGIAHLAQSLQLARAVNPLAAALKKEEDHSVKYKLIEALGNIGQPAVNPLVEIMKADSGWVRQDAARVLAAIGGAADDSLIAALQHDHPQVKITAALAIGKAKNSRAVGPLMELLSCENKTVRDSVEKALIRIGEPAVEPLISSLTHENITRRRCTVWTLGEMKDRRALDPLITLMKSEADTSVRFHCAYALGKLNDPSAVEPLLAALRDNYWNVRLHALWSLDQLKDKRAVESIIAMLRNEDHFQVRNFAVQVLGKLGDRRASKDLQTLLADQNPLMRGNAVWALGTIRDSSAVNSLIPILNDPETEPRKLAAWALGEIKMPEAAKPLLNSLRNDPSSEVRSYVIGSLGKIRCKSAVQPLIASLTDQDIKIRETAAWSLGEIGDKAAIGPLITAMNKENESIFNWLSDALRKLTGETTGDDPQAWQKWWEANKGKKN